MIQVECPSCAKSYQVLEERLGSRVKCKSCAQTFTLMIAADETHLTPVDSPSKPASDSFANLGNGSSSTPTRLAHFVLKRKLGAGAMGEVWLAEDSILEREVAVKLIPAAIVRDPERRKRFLREARLAARLTHPNTVIVYDAEVEGQWPFIAMELIDGQSLDKLVAQNGPIEWREATQMVCDAAGGLAAAHKLGLVHRDIKPANLMRTADGTVKVIDFGLALDQFSDSHLTQQGFHLGTPAYMAPEQWTGTEADARSDLYSLICTYYFLLTGVVPFEAASAPALGYQHRYEQFPDPRGCVPNLSDGICRILARGSVKAPEGRYRSAAELIAELESLIASPPQSQIFSPPEPPAVAVVAGRHSLLIAPDKLAPISILGQHAQPVIRAQDRVRPLTSGARRKSHTSSIIAICSVILLAGVALYWVTDCGTIRIELSDPSAKVKLKMDGSTLENSNLDEPLRLRAGEHGLVVMGKNYETASTSFTVRRGDNHVLRVVLQPTGASRPSAPTQRNPIASARPERPR